MNRQSIIGICVLAALSLVLSQLAEAQTPQTGVTRPGTSGTGQTNTARTTGRGGGATAGFARTQAGGYSLDARFQTGSAGMGQTTAGAGAATSGAFGQGNAGQMGGQNRFGGMTGLGGMMGMGRMGMMGTGRNMRGGQNQQMGQGNNTIRTQMRLGFSEPTPPPSAVTAQLSTVVSRVLRRPDYGGGQVNMVMEGRTAVLTGTVKSDHAREVVERLALLEPGIEDVRNELIVSPDEPTP